MSTREVQTPPPAIPLICFNLSFFPPLLWPAVELKPDHLLDFKTNAQSSISWLPALEPTPALYHCVLQHISNFYFILSYFTKKSAKDTDHPHNRRDFNTKLPSSICLFVCLIVDGPLSIFFSRNLCTNRWRWCTEHKTYPFSFIKMKQKHQPMGFKWQKNRFFFYPK